MLLGMTRALFTWFQSSKASVHSVVQGQDDVRTYHGYRAGYGPYTHTVVTEQDAISTYHGYRAAGVMSAHTMVTGQG